jgi:hypothetical protein
MLSEKGIFSMNAMKRWISVACLLLFAALLLYIIQVIPTGLGGIKQIIPYLLFSVDRGVFTSPAQTSQVRVVSNDAGAMHSGKFWTWVLMQHWWGKQVVAMGYLESSHDPVPLAWIDETSFAITFSKNRYGNEKETVEVQLP